MALASVAPALQQRLLAAQARGYHGPEDLRHALSAALDCCGLRTPAAADLRRLLEAHPSPAAVLAAAANASGHTCALGVMLAQLLFCSVVGGAELLAAVDAAELAAAIAGLHAAATSGMLPSPIAATAEQAFGALVKLLVTAAGGGAEQEQARAAVRVLQQLRRLWSTSNAPGSLLAAVVDLADAEVFPRQRATSWLAAELGRLLCAPEASGQQQDPEPAASANDAMAAFAAALPADTLLQQVQQAAWEAGTLNAQRAAALLATAAQQKPTTGQSIECWVAEQATAALQQHAAGPLRSFVMLQRALLLQQSNPSTHLPGQQADVQQSAQQRYRAWFAATLLAPEQQPLIQYLVNQLLIPLLPEEEATWLQAQADVLSALLRLAHPQQQQAPLVAGSAQAAEEYLEAAKQRLKGLQQQAAAAGVQQGEQASDLGASRTNLQRGQLVVAALLKEFVEGRGQLRSSTLAQMQAKAAGVFTRGELHLMLAPALLAPTGDAIEADKRAALMQHLYEELGQRADTQIRAHFKPEALALYRRRCLQAQLDSANLAQLAERASQLLLAPLAPLGGGISAHQLLERLGRLVGEQLAQWQEQQQRWPSSGAAEAGSPEQLVEVLLNTWAAAYCASLSSSGGSAGPAPAAVAAHVLSIAHSQPLLHAPLLRRLRQLLLEPDAVGAVVGAPSGQQQQQVEAAAMLASTAGALVQQQEQQPQRPGGGQHAVAVSSAAALQPLFVWSQHQKQTGNSGGSEAAEPAKVPGPLWLQQLMLALPLGGAVAMAQASAVASAHLSCLRHFRRYTLLLHDSSGCGAGSGAAGQQLALRWRQPSAAPASGYEGEFAAALVFPACTAALRLLQWMQLRLLVARRYLPGGSLVTSGGAVGSEGDHPPAKRPRCKPGAADGKQVLQACTAALCSEEGAPLVVAAGKLPLADFLCLEAAAAASSGRSGLLSPGAPEAAFRLCCALYLEPGGDKELGGLVQPAAATFSNAGGAPGGAQETEEVRIPDTDEEEEELLPAPSGDGGSGPSGAGSGPVATVEGVAAAVAQVLSGCGAQQQCAVAVVVCQRACAHKLRLLASVPDGPGLNQLLLELLSSLAVACQQRLPIQASAGGQQGLLLSIADRQSAEEVVQLAAALGVGLTLELLPQPLGTAARLEQQQRQLAAVAEALDNAILGTGLGAGPAAVRQLLQAALA